MSFNFRSGYHIHLRRCSICLRCHSLFPFPCTQRHFNYLDHPPSLVLQGTKPNHIWQGIRKAFHFHLDPFCRIRISHRALLDCSPHCQCQDNTVVPGIQTLSKLPGPLPRHGFCVLGCYLPGDACYHPTHPGKLYSHYITLVDRLTVPIF